MKTAIIFTTINVPTVVESYINDMRNSGIAAENALFVITGDNKSPNDAKKYINSLSSEYEIKYYDVEDQKKWYKDNGIVENDMLIPYNSMRRRNLAYLIAYSEGADNILTLDDDNFALKDNIQLHTNAFNLKLQEVSSKNRIVNPCRMLKYNHDTIIYSRGYPISELFKDTFDVKSNTNMKISMNMGLWTESPDVDSYTNIMYQDLKSEGFAKNTHTNNHYTLAKNNYMPINTQNTMFKSKLLPAYYDLLMDHKISSNKIDRYDDIWSGYIITKIMHRFDETASFGKPLVAHRRNTHNYGTDLKQEFTGIAMNSTIFNIIDNAEINAKTYADCYLQIADEFENKAKFENNEVNKFLADVIAAMRMWIALVDDVS